MSNEEEARPALQRHERAPSEQPPAPPGRGVGRPAGPSATAKKRARMQHAAEAAHTPDVDRRRQKARLLNGAKKALLESSRQYHAEHGLASRVRQVVHEHVVYIRPERKVVREAESRAVEHLLGEEEQAWLRAWVHHHAVTKNGSKFTSDIIAAVQNQFGKLLAPPEIRAVLYSMGIQWHRLYPEYFLAKAAEEYNVARRSLIVPVLHFLQNRKDVVVWNYDQCHAVVNDFVGMGWCDMTVEGAQYKDWLKKKKNTGNWLTISGFVSEAFGLLCYDDGKHVGRLAKIKSTADVVAEDFEAGAELVNRRWPQYLHLFQTDSTNVHTELIAGACNPNGINKSDGGAKRVQDSMFGRRGLVWIFTNHYGEDESEVEQQTVAELQARLWRMPEVLQQPFRLEEICQRFGSLLIFNCVGHPQLAPIELLWRDVKYDYRVATRKTMAELHAHWELWMTEAVDAEWVASYYRSSRAFVSYYLHGGMNKITERMAKQGAEDGFDELLPDGLQAKLAKMADLYGRVPGLERANVSELRELLGPYLHRLNMMRKRKSLDLA